MIDNRIFITLLLFLASIPIGFSAYEVTQCFEISEPGEYYLVQDIYAQDSNYCFRIWSGDVVLDCRGHSIIGPGFAAIEISVGSNIVVRNCNVVDWSNSLISYVVNTSILNSKFDSHVVLKLASICYLRNLSFHDRGALFIGRFANCVLEDLYFTGMGIHLGIYESSNISVRNVYMEGQVHVDVYHSVNVSIRDVYIKNFIVDEPLITLSSSKYVNIANAELYGLGGSGFAIGIMDSSYNNITNVSISNFGYGIGVGWNSSGNLFTKIAISDVITGVFVFEGAYQNYFSGLTIRNVSRDGILFSTFEFIPYGNIFEDFSILDSLNGIVFKYINGTNEFRGGVIENIMGDGIRLGHSSGQKFYGIKIKNASGCGVYLHSSGGNLFYNNMFLNRNNTCFSGDIYTNYWNTTLTKAKNIVGGPFIGGNFWGDPDGKPILEKLGFAVKDGIYEGVYDLLGDGTNVDYLPLAFVSTFVPVVVPKPFSLIGLFISITELNPFVVVLVLLIPLILVLFLIKEFREMRVDKPLDLVLKFIVIIIALALLAAAI